jgi:hypothetical protein
MSDKPNRLRRSPAGIPPADPLDHKAGLPTAGHALKVPTYPSAQGEVGVVGGEATSSTPGAGAGTCIGANYRDTADAPKPNHPPPHPHGPPFDLKR